MARKGNVAVDLSKVEVFARGKVKPFTSEHRQELIDLNKSLKGNKNQLERAAIEERIEKLDKLKENEIRSLDLANSLEKVGLPDNELNNRIITNHILNAAQNVTKAGFTDLGHITTSNGKVFVKGAFKHIDTGVEKGTKFLNSITLTPKLGKK